MTMQLYRSTETFSQLEKFNKIWALCVNTFILNTHMDLDPQKAGDQFWGVWYCWRQIKGKQKQTGLYSQAPPED